MELEKLSEPFPPEMIEWRLQSCGIKKGSGDLWAKALAYITNRAIMDRLDAECGPENWKNTFTPAPGGGVLCGIAIKCGDEWVAKFDGAENTALDAVKGGLSGAMKRAAVQWGIGRYLYGLEVVWVDRFDSDKYAKGAKEGKTKEGREFGWFPPSLPSWALPEGTKSQTKQQPKQETQRPDNGTPSEKITDAQRKKLHAAFTGLGYDEEKRHEYISENYGGRTSFNDLSKQEASGLIESMAGSTG